MLALQLKKNKTRQLMVGAAVVAAIAVLLGATAAALFKPTSKAANSVPSAASVLHQSDDMKSYPTEITRSEMNAAEALLNGQPTLFYFYPAEACQVRYCRQPEMIEAELRAEYGETVDFVTVTVEALPADQGPEQQHPIYHNLGMYPVASIVEILPQMTVTEWGIGLASPQITITDGNGEVIASGGEFFGAAELAQQLHPVIGQ